MHEARYYSKLEQNRVLCSLCPHHCRIAEGKHGVCLTRDNIGGTLIASNYCRPVSTAIDPIEKKPLFHYYPGSSIFSTGPCGCNFKCSFCQNFQISQRRIDSPEIPVDRFVKMVRESATIGIAYTYTEPYLWFETIMDVGREIRELGLKNVMVTNGFMEPEPLAELLTVVDAMNIDIKSMNPEFYSRLCKGSLEPVLRSCEQVKKAGCHLEITWLLITDENDREEEMRQIAGYVASNLGPDTPLHISRYFPRYHLDRAPTPGSELDRAYRIARERLQYVYVGNVRTGSKEDTYCPRCGTLLIRRQGYSITKRDALSVRAKDGKSRGVCAACDYATNIVL